MWYVLEVCEYLDVRNPSKNKEIFRPSVMGILAFLERYENSDGLIRGNILVYDGIVVGGDICSVELGGFMHTFSMPTADNP